MNLKELHELQSLAKQARQDFKIEIEKNYTYQQLEDITGLSVQQLFRFVNEKKGQPKLESLISSYIRLLEFGGTTPKK